MGGYQGRNELQFYEDSCKRYAAYAWLAYRMPDTFPDGDMAQMMMQSTSEKIDKLLQVQNTRSRQGKRPEQQARRSGGGQFRRRS
jgi:ATP-dependent RNA helicase SUPV3L1/SUV3